MKGLEERRKICNRLGERYYPLGARRDRVLEAAIEQRLPAGGVFLDGGAGPALRLASRFAGRCGLSVGMDTETILASATALGARGVQGDLEMTPFAAASLDVIALRSVVEHLADPARALAELGRALKPGGWVLAMAPSRWYYASIAGRVLPRRAARAALGFIYGPGAYDNYPTWYRANTPRAMARAAKASGLTLVETRLLPHPPDYLKFSPALFRLGVLFDRLTGSVRWLHVLQPSFLFVLRKG